MRRTFTRMVSVKQVWFVVYPVNFSYKCFINCSILKVLAFWGIGTALLGAQTKRTVLLTGTPYNNSHRDMAALMTFIDPNHPSAKVSWHLMRFNIIFMLSVILTTPSLFLKPYLLRLIGGRKQLGVRRRR